MIMFAAGIKNTQINETETAQQAAIIKHYKELLQQQCKNFRNYRTVLEKQENLINTDNGSSVFTEQLLAGIELEEQIVASIISIQKVIDPLDDMYRKLILFPQNDISELNCYMEDLKKQAINLSTHNKELIQNRIIEIRSEITTLKNNPFISSRQAIYKNSNSALYLDIEG